MAARLKPKTGAKGVERVADREIEKAIEALDGRWPLPDEAVHGARKGLKRARAALRLLREALGDRAYRRENRALRDAARPLSELRDAVVLVQTFDALELNGSPSAASLRAALIQHQKESRRRVLADHEHLEPVLSTLRSSRKHVARARPRRHGWDTIGPGLRRTYRAGRRALQAARQDPTDVRLHEWRKQVKYLRHVVEVLQPIWPAGLSALARRTHRLSDQLGEDHDLAVLRRRPATTRPPVSSATRDAALERIDVRRATLQKRAMALGAIVYKDRPRTLERRLHRRWRAWRSQKKSR